MNNEELFKKATQLESEGMHQAALSEYRKIIKTSDDPRHFIAYGVCLQKLGHWKQSINALEKGISLKPHYCEGDARLFLATAHLKTGKKNLAIKQWQHVAKMQPEYPSYESVPNEAKKMLAQYS